MIWKVQWDCDKDSGSGGRRGGVVRNYRHLREDTINLRGKAQEK